MGRPSKNVNLLSKHLTKEEKQNREEQEEKLKGRTDNIVPTRQLNDNQLYWFNYIKSELEESKLLTNLDVFILTNVATTIDRIQWIENQVDKKPSLLFNDTLMRRRKEYASDFYRGLNELSLSPQSRAKLANINQNAETDKEDPLLKALRGEEK